MGLLFMHSLFEGGIDKAEKSIFWNIVVMIFDFCDPAKINFRGLFLIYCVIAKLNVEVKTLTREFYINHVRDFFNFLIIQNFFHVLISGHHPFLRSCAEA